MGCTALIACLAACSDDASPSFAGPAESSAASSSSVIPAESSAESSSSAAGQSSSSSEIAAASSSSIDNVIESSAASSSSMTIESSCSAETASSSSAEPAAQYLWHDEFDGETIDTSKWTFEIGTGAGGWGNNEWEYYTSRKENAYVKDGVLHIRAQKEDYEGQK